MQEQDPKPRAVSREDLIRELESALGYPIDCLRRHGGGRGARARMLGHFELVNGQPRQPEIRVLAQITPGK